MPDAHAPRIERVGDTIEARWGGNSVRPARADGGIPIAHLGCQHVRRTASPRKLPAVVREQCDAKYESRWRGRLPAAADRVAAAIADGVMATKLGGAMLIDTMRGGSDYWRPGKLLSDVAELLRQRGLEVAYAREDAICPGRDLLDRFRDDASMSFGAYAELYRQQLFAEDKLGPNTGAFVAVSALGRGLLPVFYCTDPYLPGYLPDASAGRPFAERGYLTDPTGYLRERGCHRVVLAECLAEVLRSLGTSALIVDLDVNVGASYVRSRASG